MATQVVKVRRDKLTACMTCPLCNKLLKEATTISICLHTFCRKCIYEKISDEDVDTCPVCDISLGCVPEDKLRPDHNLQDIRAKIFPLRRRKIEAPEVPPSVSPPTKRKERSLSSLVVSTPRVSMQAGLTGKRMRAGGKKGSNPQDGSPADDESPNKDEDSEEDQEDGSSSPETLNKIVQNKKQSSSDPMDNNNEVWKGKNDLWKPLNTLVEAANRSKFSKAYLQGLSLVKSEPSSSRVADVGMSKIKTEENGHGPEPQDENMAPGPVKRKRVRKSKIQAPDASSSQVMLSAASRNWKDGPIWFSLVASEDPEGGEPLPQVASSFLRVKDGNMPVSYIQKYLVKKLDLTSEAEVQLTCLGQPVLPNLKISSLVDIWLHSFSNPKMVRTTVGESAKEFIMVLSYSRKVQPPHG